jgi:cell division inhibitor SulA
LAPVVVNFGSQLLGRSTSFTVFYASLSIDAMCEALVFKPEDVEVPVNAGVALNLAWKSGDPNQCLRLGQLGRQSFLRWLHQQARQLDLVCWQRKLADENVAASIQGGALFQQ